MGLYRLGDYDIGVMLFDDALQSGKDAQIEPPSLWNNVDANTRGPRRFE